MNKKFGFILLAVWLIVTGLIVIIGLSFKGLHTIMAILAIASGVLVLLDR